MPIEPIEVVDLAALSNKVNELIDFVNHIQKSGTANFMIWTGDGIVPPVPVADTTQEETVDE